MSEQANESAYVLTNAQAALMAAVEVEKNSGETYRYAGQQDAQIAERATEFLAFLNASTPPSQEPTS